VVLYNLAVCETGMPEVTVRRLLGELDLRTSYFEANGSFSYPLLLILRPTDRARVPAGS